MATVLLIVFGKFITKIDDDDYSYKSVIFGDVVFVVRWRIVVTPRAGDLWWIWWWKIYGERKDDDNQFTGPVICQKWCVIELDHFDLDYDELSLILVQFVRSLFLVDD